MGASTRAAIADGVKEETIIDGIVGAIKTP